jgi:alkylhydroperoxidase family enzyme
MAVHSTFALKHGLAPAVVAALRAGLPLPDERLQELHGFAGAVLRERGYVEAARQHAFEAAGFTPEQMFEVIAQVGYTCLANWVANLCDPPLEEPFQPQHWSSAAR